MGTTMGPETIASATRRFIRCIEAGHAPTVERYQLQGMKRPELDVLHTFPWDVDAGELGLYASVGIDCTGCERVIVVPDSGPFYHRCPCGTIYEREVEPIA